jgi:hypothetical protein
MSEFLIFEDDVMGRGKFNILIVTDDAEFTKIFPDALVGRVAMADYETKTIVMVAANETGDPLVNLTHEMAHAIFFERMGGGTKIPDWIHEGLASYIESHYNSSQVDLRWTTFGADIAQTGGQPLTSLSAPKTNNPEEVSRFYTQSYSVVRYLIDNYGMLKLMKLGIKLQSGKDIDKSLGEVYAPDITNLSDLETKWLVSIRT